MGWWVLTTLRRDRWSRVFIVLVGGLSIGLVAAAWQAERRSEGSVQRLISYSDVADELIFSCPPGLDVVKVPALLTQCGTKETARAAAIDLQTMPDVVSAGVGAPVVIALLDPSASNGWGRVTVAYASAEPGLVAGRPIIVAGRLPADDAPDEIALTEIVSKSTGLHVGDTAHLAGWTGTDGRFDNAPDGAPFDSRVVGIIRSVADLAPARANDLTGTTLGDGVYAGPGWTAAHTDGLFSYGWGALVHLQDHRTDSFNDALATTWTDRFFQSGTVIDSSLSSLNRSINTERAAIDAFAVIGAIASGAAIALALDRQLKREAADATSLASLGASRSELRFANALGALAVGVPTAVLAAITCFALSWFAPLGLARRAEPKLRLRLDLTVTMWAVVAVVALAALVGALARIDRTAAHRRAPRTSRTGAAMATLGAVPRVGLGLARG
ncbi:MAG: hypothetical protein JWN99_1377, partial [Ilumatobacteraceae bacterium]|nr:hypothetical protein [Ilumatobacteraceae bacterium]